MTTRSFSVVIPAFNAEQTIDASLRSVLAQTRTDFEVVVVDDGSTDQTARRVEVCADPRIRLLRQPNAGPAAARNAGIAATTGHYVSFLDADDLWLPNYLAEMGRALTARPDAGLAFTDAWVWDENVDRFGRRMIMATVDPPKIVPTDPRELFRELLARNFFYVSTTVRRSVLEHVGGFDETVRGSEDWDLWLRITASGYSALRAAPVLAVYRIRAGSLSADRGLMREAARQSLEKATTYVLDPELLGLVRERLARLAAASPGGREGAEASSRGRMMRLLPSWARVRNYRMTSPPEISREVLELLRSV